MASLPGLQDFRLQGEVTSVTVLVGHQEPHVTGGFQAVAYDCQEYQEEMQGGCLAASRSATSIHTRLARRKT